jgi:hypothetical protein
VASHRRPVRRFQLIGAFVLVVGAVGGSYAAFSNRPAPHAQPAGEVTVLPPAEPVPGDAALHEAYLAKKAIQIAAEEAEAARRANEVAAAQQAAQQAPAPNIPASCDEYSGNRALGCAVLLEVGFGLDQMGCLEALWTRESNWRENARNASSGAHGIPQALPAEKMAVFGADYLTNPVTQIRWGLDYIAKRYSTPCGAWNFWQANHWY